MTTYNGEKFLFDQLDSILEQTGDFNLEIIISDDGSSDGTLDILKKYPCIKVITGERLGVINNFERSLSFATGDYIFLADQDDIWKKNKLLVMTTLLREHDLIVSDAELINSDGLLLGPSMFNLINSGPGLIKNIYKNTFLGCCIGFRRELLEMILPFPRGIPMHDIWIGCAANMLGSVSFINAKLVSYRRHGNNLSPTSEVSRHSIIQKVKWRLILVVQLIKLYIKINFYKAKRG